jgi:hypothetical protein
LASRGRAGHGRRGVERRQEAGVYALGQQAYAERRVGP